MLIIAVNSNNETKQTGSGLARNLKTRINIKTFNKLTVCD